MARLFGGASTDRLQGTISAYDSGPWTCFAWIRYDGGGGGGFGRVIHCDVGNLGNGVGINENTGQIGGKQPFSTQSLEYGDSTFGSAVWRFHVFTYNGTSQPPDDDGGTTNDECAHFWGDVSTSMVQVDTSVLSGNVGSGTRLTGLVDLMIGNRPSLNRNWNGGIFCVGMVPYMMSITDAETLRTGDLTPLADNDDPIFFFGLEGTDLDSYPTLGPSITLTATGTTDITDPITLTPPGTTYTQDVDGAIEPTGELDAIQVTVYPQAVGGEIEPAGALTTEFIVGSIEDPTDLTGLFGWWDGDDDATFTLTGDQIDLWEDKSGNDWHLGRDNGTGPERVLGQLNGRDVVGFGGWGGTARLSTEDEPDATTPQPITVFVVAQFDVDPGGGQNGIIIEGTGGTNEDGFSLGRRGTTGNLFAQGGENVNAGAASECAMTENVPHLITAVYDGADSYLRMDQAEQFTVELHTYGIDTWFYVGDARISNQTFDGYIAELVIYERVLTEIEVNAVEAYLTEKWGLTFTPLLIPGCEVWLDASDDDSFTFSSGVEVATWTNLGGGGSDFTPGGTGSGAPERDGTQNGLTTVRWTGDDRNLQSANTTSQPWTVFVVGKVSGTVDHGLISDVGDQPSLYRTTPADNTHPINFDAGAVDVEILDPAGYHIISWVGNGASSVQRIERTEVGTTNTGTAGFDTGVQLGDHFSQGTGVFEIAEVIVYDSALDSTQIDQVEEYLDDKWFRIPTEVLPAISVAKPPPVLDRTHPLAQGLVFYTCDGVPLDLVTNAPGLYSTASPASRRRNRATRWGSAFESTDADSGRVHFRDTRIAESVTTQHTMFMAIDLDDPGNSGIISMPWNTGFPAVPYHSLAFGPDVLPRPFMRYAVSSTRQDWLPTVAPEYEMTAGEHTYVWTRNQDQQRYYKDGSMRAEATYGLTGNVDFGGNETHLCLMSYSEDFPRDDDDGAVAVVAIWNRALTPAEVALFSADPKCVLVRPGAPVVFGPYPALTAPAIPESIEDPTDLTGLQLWLDADDAGSMTLSGDEITLWEDKSGTGNDFIPIVAGVGADYTPATLNGKAVAMWNAANTGFRRDTLDLPQPFTFFMVIYFESLHPSLTSSIFTTRSAGAGGSPGNSGIAYHPVNDGSMIQDNGTGGVYPANTFEIDAATPYYMTFVYDGASSLARNNGVQQFAVNVGTNDFSGGFTIGRSNSDADGLGERMPGSYIAEIVLYERVLISDEIELVEAYLVEKWFTAGPSVTDIYGDLLKQTNKALAAALVPAGAITARSLATAYAGVLVPAGTVAKQTDKTFAGAITPAGALTAEESGGDVTDQPVDGTITPTGVLTKQVDKAIITASITPTGTVTKLVSKVTSGGIAPAGQVDALVVDALTGTITPTGTVTKLLSRTLTAAIAPTGAVTKQTNKVTSGGITPTGQVDEQAAKALAGTLAPAGALTKVTLKNPAGAITPTGALASTFSFNRTFDGTITPTGTVTKLLSRTLTANVTPTGALTKETAKHPEGAVVPTGTVTKLVSRALASAITPTGTIANTQTVSRDFTGAITPAGAIDVLVLKALTANITPAGQVDMFLSRALTSAVTPAGTVTRLISRGLAANITPAGVLSKVTSRTLTGAITPTGQVDALVTEPLTGTIPTAGVITKLVSRTLTGGLTPTGTVDPDKFATRAVAGAITPTGTVTRLTNKPLAAGLTPAAALTRLAYKNLAGTCLPTGNLSTQSGLQVTAGGTIAPTGAITKLVSRAFTGALTPGPGGLTRSLSRTVSGTVALSGSLSPALSKALAGAVVPSGAVTKVTAVRRAGTLAPTGAISQSFAKNLAASVPPTGAATRLTYKPLAANLTPAGTLVAQREDEISGSCTPTGDCLRLTFRTVAGAIVAAGTVARAAEKALSGAVAPTGALVAGQVAGLTFDGTVGITAALTATKIPGGPITFGDGSESGERSPSIFTGRPRDGIRTGSKSASVRTRRGG